MALAHATSFFMTDTSCDVDRQRRPSAFDTRANLFMAPALEADVLRELCLVLLVLLNIARGRRETFHAAVQHWPGFGQALGLFSK
jgi:hypothetical protein